jgi:hypothetical protein
MIRNIMMILLITILIFIPLNDSVFALESESENVTVNVINDKVNIAGKLNDKNEDITIIVYRSSDNLKAYIDQGKTNESGEFAFSFALLNGTYTAVISSKNSQYTTEKITVYKAPDYEEPEEINVTVNENKVSITGKINEKSEDVTLIVYKYSDNSKAYIDQGKTNESGEFAFSFALLNGTYTAVISSKNSQYTTEKITVYKAPSEEEPVDINITVNENKVSISGKINEKSEKIALIVYRDSDNSKAYIDQGVTNENGEFAFLFILPNGTYTAMLSSGDNQYITEKITVLFTKPIVSAEITPSNATFDKNSVKQNNVTTNITWNDAEQVIDVKKANGVSIGKENYSIVNNELTIKKEYLANQENGSLVLLIFFNKGQEATMTINIINTTNGGGDSGDSGSKKPIEKPAPEPIILPSDISGHWAEQYIIELISRGIVSNYPDNTFRPDINMTRAEFATIIVKALDLKLTQENIFTDVENHWAKSFIATATEYGIISGYGNNIFGPDDMITREQMSVMILKALKFKLVDSEIKYLDKDQISDWAYDFVATVLNYEIMKGYPDGTFRPKSYATRAEVAVVIIRMLESDGH